MENSLKALEERLMDKSNLKLQKKDLEILNLFNRYLDWIKNNNLQDNIDNYRTYFKYIENI
ncbi:hypothetical protein B0H39_005965 [Clostridium beijerinckii]|uniref:hypothetical protein n=1 Tax=Clostridium beijerinckii TaxID=1520 RepID=UPI001494647E|nr:hypothetical protein [Clostridium beijerinckii]NOW87934.1 hypothetical protein [Clostridium beijerinckii]